MSFSPDESLSALAGSIPDDPRWIDLRGLLLSGRCDLWAEANPELGFIAGSWDFPFAALWGDPAPETILTAVSESRANFEGSCSPGEWLLLAPPERRSAMEPLLRGWRRRGIVLHRRREPRGRPEAPGEIEVRLLPEGHHGLALSFDRFPGPTRRELTLDWVSGRPMAVAIADSYPVAYCYAAFITEGLWDVAVETAAPYRRHGLAAACFLTLAAHMTARGRSPTWAAMRDNPASLALAARLGFSPVATLDGWSEAAGS